MICRKLAAYRSIVDKQMEIYHVSVNICEGINVFFFNLRSLLQSDGKKRKFVCIAVYFGYDFKISALELKLDLTLILDVCNKTLEKFFFVMSCQFVKLRYMYYQIALKIHNEVKLSGDLVPMKIYNFV